MNLGKLLEQTFLTFGCKLTDLLLFDFFLNFVYISLKRNLYYGGKNTFAPNYEEGHLVPSFSVSVGTSFYVWKYFNFYANLAYVNSNLKAVSGGPFKTDELIFSAGLGFQIQTRKN